MPRIENIRKFNEQLTQLGDEPRIAAVRGEQIEDPRPAEENLEAGAAPSARAARSEEPTESGESAEATEGEQAAGEVGEGPGSEEDPDEGMDDDLRALLGDMGEDAEDAEDAEGGEAGGGEAEGDTSGAEELASEADLGDEAEEEDPFAGIDLDFADEEGESAEDVQDTESEGAEDVQDTEDEGAETAPEPDEAEPDEPEDDETFDLSDLDEVGEEAEAEAVSEELEELTGEEAPDPGEPEPEPAEPEPDEAAEPEAADPGEPEPEPAEPEAGEAAPDEPEDDEPEPAQPESAESAESEELTGEESASEDEDFDLGSVLDDLDLDEPEDATTPAEESGEGLGEEEPGEEDEFDFDLDLGEEEEDEDSSDESEAAAPGPEGEEPEETDETGGLEEVEEFGEPEEEDEFDLDLDEGFSFSDEEVEEPAEAEAVDEDLAGEPEELSATDEGASDEDLEEDEFDMGDFGEFGEAVEESGEDFSFDEPDDTEGEEGEEGEEFAELDEFSLGDFGAEFGVIESGEEESADEESELNPAAAPPTDRPESEGTDAGPGIHLSDRQFGHLKETLDTLPLNLRTIVEELIAGGEFSEEEIKPLVDKLVEGDSPKSIARTAGGLKGEHIRLPHNYEVRRGVVFEEEKATFAWQFRHRYLPMARNALLAGIILAGAVYLVYTYVYQPLYARSLYLQGLEEIEEDRYTVGNDFFDEAREVWQTRDWFYRYAESFIDKRQFRLAREKFDQLLEDYPSDIEGLLRYADLESRILGNYERAEALYNTVLSIEPLNYNGIIGTADNYLRWGERDRSKFEQARYYYARAYQNYGATNEIMQRFMRYFVRTDNLGEVEPLVRMFEEERTEAEIDPEIYSETAGYLLDYERITYIRDMLDRAREVDPELPDVHYQLARFYDYTDERSSQAVALQKARTLFPEYEPLGSRRLGMHIDTYTLSAEYYHEGEEYLTAERYYAEAIDRYESARASDLVDVEERFGRMYAGLGDIYYYRSGEYDAARDNYESAEQNEYSTNDMRYKLGWIDYRDEDYDGAIDRFETVSNNPSARNIRYALANTHYYRDNYFASETYLRELLDILEQERQRIGLAFNPEENAEHRNIVRYKVMANNNLGVVMARRFEQEGDRELRGDALYYLTNSTQDATDVTRDPRTAVRADTTDLAFLNQRYLLYPDQPYSLRIYRDLPIDLEDQDFFPAQL